MTIEIYNSVDPHNPYAQFFDVMPNHADHSHLVVVGENDEKSMMGEDVIGLPRPPLIVLRYIIYWPD